MQSKIKQGYFIEWAEFSGNLYGTSVQAIQDISSTGKVCLLDLDLQGVKSFKKLGINATYIFIKPPSLKALEERLGGRGTETKESLAARLASASASLEFAEKSGTYDAIIVNDNLTKAYEDLKSFLRSKLIL
eukprot:Colp12_sorted_trinity150504_noHs@15477